jgi:hypothetical protein
MKQTVSLDEMRQRVARLIFGDDWIGGLTDEQYELLRAHSPKAQPIVRSDGSTVHVEHVKRCPTRIAEKLDRAIGRQARMGAQYVTVDSWIEDQGLPVASTDRKKFNEIVRSQAESLRPVPVERRRGPPPQILLRVIAAMKGDISGGLLSPHDLDAMPDKELEFRYQAKRERVRAARRAVLAKTEI